jgi:hypothetical protein
MSNGRVGRGTERWGFVTREALLALSLWVATFMVFRSAPVQQLHDSKYTMLLAAAYSVRRQHRDERGRSVVLRS